MMDAYLTFAFASFLGVTTLVMVAILVLVIKELRKKPTWRD